MRFLLYILVVLMLFSCTRQKEHSPEPDTVAEPAEYIAADDTETQAKMAEEANLAPKEEQLSKATTNAVNTAFIQQQLQETINLIGLKNSADLAPELQQDLEKNISQKVKSNKINPSLGIIEVKNIEVKKTLLDNDATLVDFTFETKNIENKTQKGGATARITNEFIKVDEVVYTDYRIYFEEITIP